MAAIGLTAGIRPLGLAPTAPSTSADAGTADAGTADAGTATARLGAAPTPAPAATASVAAAPPTSAPPAPRQPAPQPATDGITALEDLVTELANDERVAAGCEEQLRTDERLRTAARGHSQDMADHDYFSHTGLDGSSPSDRARRAGYPGGVGENIAAGYRTPEDVMRGWMDSDGHRANLLECEYVAIGVGLAYDAGGRPYWTQNFGFR
jgi:uncharacterized protein YkwD